MDEIMEAERFNVELEKVLAGKPAGADLDAELRADLAFAARLSAMDFSAESRAKAPAKAKILEKSRERGLRVLLRRPAVRTLALASFGLVLVLAPFAYKWIASEQDRSVAGPNMFVSGWGGDTFSQGSSMFGSAGSPDDAGGAANESDYKDARVGPIGKAAPAGGLYDDPQYGPALRSAAVRQARMQMGAVRGGALSSSLGGTGGLAAYQAAPQPLPVDREGYGYTEENAFQRVADHPLSTFSIDVDAASYSNVRRILNEGRLPPEDAVRVEEFINYFKYDYPEPEGEHPFSITTELAACPWNAAHKLVRVGLKGKSIATKNLPPNNLVFLIDTSGSMMGADRLGLIQQGLRLLVEQMRKQDRISIVAYAGSAGLVLPSTSGAKKEDIYAALERLQAGGSTAGGAGIQLAYKTAEQGFLKNGNNRVILATDGDFNVGVTSDGELTRLIEEKREHGVFLTVLGVGAGNVQDHKMEQLADKGNGNYAFLDDVHEARKVLVKEMGGTLLTIAKDVKLQVEFNPARASSYKLIGYENRMLKSEDFNDDKKDAGELGAGHTVTALYEIVPAGAAEDGVPAADALKYQKPAEPAADAGKELLTVKFRYKKPNEDVSRLLARPLADESREWAQASPDFKFAAAAAGFGMVLRGSKTKGDLDYDKVRTMAQDGLVHDEDGYRSEMVRLIAKAKALDKRNVVR